jgi:class 3 adenylate cyclase
MVGFVLIWPHLFYWLARRAKSGYRAEGINILLDSVYEGVLLPALGFRLIPCTLVIASGSLNTLIFFGWRMVLPRIGLIAVGLLIGYGVFGFDIHLDTEPLATGLSIFTLVAYVAFVGATLHQIRTGLRSTRIALESEKLKSQQLLFQSEQLLQKVFPQAIIPRLHAGESPIADEFADVTVLFADIVGYTTLAERLGPRKTVMLLNDLYKRFDQAAAQFGVEKIETVGDGYLAACGAPERHDHHPEAVAALALAMIEAARQVPVSQTEVVQIRVGVHTGPVFGGVIGEHRFHYAIFGETVNVASRVQSHSRPGGILVSDATYKRIRGSYKLEECASLDLKGHGPMRTHWLLESGDGSRPNNGFQSGAPAATRA